MLHTMGCPLRLLRMKQSFNEGKKGTVQYDVYNLDTMTATHQRSYTCLNSDKLSLETVLNESIGKCITTLYNSVLSNKGSEE